MTRVNLISLIVAVLWLGNALGCTDILVTPGASKDGSSMIAYNAGEICNVLCVFRDIQRTLSDNSHILPCELRNRFTDTVWFSVSLPRVVQ